MLRSLRNREDTTAAIANLEITITATRLNLQGKLERHYGGLVDVEFRTDSTITETEMVLRKHDFLAEKPSGILEILVYYRKSIDRPRFKLRTDDS